MGKCRMDIADDIGRCSHHGCKGEIEYCQAVVTHWLRRVDLCTGGRGLFLADSSRNEAFDRYSLFDSRVWVVDRWSRSNQCSGSEDLLYGIEISWQIILLSYR